MTTTDSDTVEVATTAGRVRGRWRTIRGAATRSAAFLGISFARAPVGRLRFAAPARPEPWDGVRDALRHGPTPQRRPIAATPLIPEPSVPGDDTLNVDVFTPAPGDPAAKLAVLVWIHGGGFTAGSPASPWYDGQAFNRDGVVTVSVSYRLGFDGFGMIPGAPSNRGVRDWLAALEWVQENIAAFGGDPGRVTIAGQSAGGGAVLTLLGMPVAQHLFQRAWALSPAVADVTVARAATAAATIARRGGVPANRDGFATLDEQRILDLQAQLDKPASGDPADTLAAVLRDGLLWGPALDGELLTRPTPDAVRAGVGADKPLVLGCADDEFTMVVTGAATRLRFVPVALALRRLGLAGPRRSGYLRANRARRRRGTAAMLGRYVSDVVFRAPAVRLADARGTAPTWMYRLTWPSPRVGWACHCLDVPFWWDCLDSPSGIAELAGPHPPRPLAEAVHGSAASFARHGDPGWPAWSSRPGTTRLFGAGPADPDVVPDGYASVLPLLCPAP